MAGSAKRFLLTATIAFVAAGIAALAVLLLPLALFIAILVSCALLAGAATAWLRKDRARAQREAIEVAHEARIADLQRRADALKAREHAIEDAQRTVLEPFRKEHGL